MLKARDYAKNNPSHVKYTISIPILSAAPPILKPYIKQKMKTEHRIDEYRVGLKKYKTQDIKKKNLCCVGNYGLQSAERWGVGLIRSLW